MYEHPFSAARIEERQPSEHEDALADLNAHLEAEAMRDAADDRRKRDRENGIPNPLVEAWKDEQHALSAERGYCQRGNGDTFYCIQPNGHEGGCFLVTTTR